MATSCSTYREQFLTNQTKSHIVHLPQVRFRNILSSKSQKVCPTMDGISREKETVESAVSGNTNTASTGTFCSSMPCAFRCSRRSIKISSKVYPHQHIKSCFKVKAHERHSVEEKIVRFGTVKFREYYPVLSNNPSTTSGPPIGIGWRYKPEEITLDLDLYEFDREFYRRKKQELVIPPQVRDDILREAGYSRHEISLAIRRAQEDRDRRYSSVKLQKFDPILERVDRFKRIIPSMK